MVNFQPQLNQIGQQRDFTRSLMAQSLAPQQNQTALTGIARILSAYLANKNLGALGQKEQDVMSQQSKARQGELSRILGMTKDRPAQTLQPGEMGPPTPAMPGIPMGEALMQSSIPEFQEMGVQHALRPTGEANTPSNVSEWNFYNSLSEADQRRFLDMKRSGFGAGGVQYTASGQQIVPTDKVANDKAQIAGAVAGAQETGKQQAQNQAALSGDEFNAQQTTDLIDDLLNHPGLEYSVGTSSVLPVIPGTDAASFHTRLDQLKGKQFLEAYSGLKGGGHITEIEGQKAEQAIARLNVAQTEEEFKSAATELKTVIQVGLQRKRQNAGAASPGGQGQLITPQTQEEFDSLPSGTVYIDPDDGKQYRKP